MFTLLSIACCFLAEPTSSKSSSILFLSNLYQLDSFQRVQSPKSLPSARIVGGTAAKISDFPFIVLVYERRHSGFMCGGTLFHPAKVLTGCHCAVQSSQYILGSNYTVLRPNALMLEAGMTDKYIEDTNRQTKQSKAITVHPKCAFSKKHYWEYDFAVVTAHSPFRATAFVAPIQILADDPGIVDRMIKNKVSCYIAGWGNIAKNGPPITSNVLLKAPLSLISPDECTKLMNNIVKRKDFIFKVNEKIQLCALEPEKYAGKGDSGGPLVCRGTLVGVISMAINKTTGDVPAIFARVDAAAVWIYTGRELSKQRHESGIGSILRSNIILLTLMWALVSR